MIPFDPSSGFPPIDTGTLRGVVGFLNDGSGKLAAQATALTSAVGSVRAGGSVWQGDAATTWESAGQERSSWYSQAGSAWSQIAGVLSAFADQVDAARTRYVRANQAAFESSQLAGRLQVLATAQAGPPDPQLTARAQWANQDAQDSVTNANVALTNVTDAVQSTARQLTPLVAEAQAFCQHPLTPGSRGGSLAPSAPWLTLLFGSVVGNRVSGRAFQDQVLKDLGINENTTSFQVRLPDGTEYTTIPDAAGDTVIIEVKGVGYLSNSAQIRAEIRLAETSGRTPDLVVQPRTQVSRPLMQEIEQANGTIRVRLGDNVYRDYKDQGDNPTLYRGDGKGGYQQIEEQAPQGEPTVPDSSGVPVPEGATGQGSGSTGGTDMPVAPEGGDPVLPEEPMIDPLP